MAASFADRLLYVICHPGFVFIKLCRFYPFFDDGDDDDDDDDDDYDNDDDDDDDDDEIDDGDTIEDDIQPPFPMFPLFWIDLLDRRTDTVEYRDAQMHLKRKQWLQNKLVFT